MKIDLLHYTPLEIAAEAIRICYDSMNKSDNLGEKDKALIKKIIKLQHNSVFEHCKITFYTDIQETIDFFKCNRYSYTIKNIITTNLRVLLENKYHSRYVIYELLKTEMNFIFNNYKIHPYFPHYKIYDFGLVERFKRFNKNDTCKLPLILKPYIDLYGYPEVQLIDKNHKKRHKTIHRLLAECFIENPDPKNKTQVNHKDGIKTNNELYNLEWVTPSENEKHSYEVLGKVNPNKGKKLPSGKEYRGKIRPVYQCTLDGEIIKEWFNPTEAANALGLPVYGISHCALGKQKTHGGYVWRYKNES